MTLSGKSDTPLHRTRFTYWPRRIWLLVKDYVTEFPMVWSIVRAFDCERWGGHYWGEPRHDRVVVPCARSMSGPA